MALQLLFCHTQRMKNQREQPHIPHDLCVPTLRNADACPVSHFVFVVSSLCIPLRTYYLLQIINMFTRVQSLKNLGEFQINVNYHGKTHVFPLDMSLLCSLAYKCHKRVDTFEQWVYRDPLLCTSHQNILHSRKMVQLFLTVQLISIFCPSPVPRLSCPPP